MMKEKDNARLQGLKDRLLHSASEGPTIQKVVPTGDLQLPAHKKEIQLNVQIDEELVDRLKIHGIKAKKSLKQLVTEAISMMLNDVENPTGRV